MVHVGIDIGTSNTVLAYLSDQGDLITHRIDEAFLVPSVVYVEERAGRTTVGRAAVEEWTNPEFSPKSSFRRWKLAVGTGTALGELALGGGDHLTSITPEQLTTWLVEYVAGELAGGVGGQAIDSVVVTVPHGWRRETPERCAATRSAAGAATVAGTSLNVKELTLSEPVSAASYWLWEARRTRPELDAEFVGHTVLVVDIGGGTFDLSLVRVGPPDTPLVVVDAINSETAGDFATALLLARATGLANAELGEDFPDNPQELLGLLASGTSPWVRTWFVTAEEMLHKASLSIRKAREGRMPIVQPAVFDLPDGRSVRLKLSAEAFGQALEPFYDAGRSLLTQFFDLQKPEDKPHGVVFAGGGSRIAGVRERIVAQALNGRVEHPDEVLDRIVINDAKVDQAIALGAALVASGLVSVEERLLYDVGLSISLPAKVSKALGLGESGDEVILSPILPRSSRLPVSADSTELVGNLSIAPGKTYNVKVVVFDDPEDPFVQEWEMRHPAEGARVAASVVITADADGVLTCRVDASSGTTHTVKGKTSRVRSGRASLMLDLGEDARPSLRVITPEQLRGAADKLRSGSSQPSVGAANASSSTKPHPRKRGDA